MAENITFKPKQVVKDLLGSLAPRAREVLELRYGLGKNPKKSTLETIGKKYGITRERVRQIENYAIAAIRKSDGMKEKQKVFEDLKTAVDALGCIVSEEDLLTTLSKNNENTKNYVHFLLVLGDMFEFRKSNTDFSERWTVDGETAEKIESSLKELYANLSDNELVSEGELIDQFLSQVKNLNQRYQTEEIVRRWLSMTKSIGKNPLGEWGRTTSSNVRAKGIRDYAYLVIKRHGSPMHFREVAKAIEELFARKAHEATCHNELIKDKRFVLVGRGLYALSEWGYTAGVVKDVIYDILKEEGPLSREEVIDRVQKERYVKQNTIVVNLQDSTWFKQNSDGTYSIVE